jgi:glucokinase
MEVNMNYYVGVDLGGTNIVVGLVNEDYQIIERCSCSTNLPRAAKEIVDDIADLIHQLLAKQNITIEQIRSIGVGVPGTANKESGMVEYANNLGFYDVPFVSLLKEHFNTKICFDNDGNAAVWGEYLAGCGKGYHSLIAITLGTGVGGGIVINDELYTGSNYAAAEIGHHVICMDGVPCNCGRNGCFEAYASATALVEQTRAAMELNKESYLWELCERDITKVEGKILFQAVAKGDKTAAMVLEQFIKYLSVGVTNLINIFQPDILCIGGGISKAGNIFIEPLIERVNQEIYTRNSSKQTKIVIAALDNDAGIIGAAHLVK